MDKKRIRTIWLLALGCFLLDQGSKWVITSCLKVNEGFSIMKDFFSIIYIRNKGAAWGVLENNTILLIAISILFLVALIKYITSQEKWNMLEILSFGLLLGGIFGNLFDRIVRGYVVDFLSVRIFGYSFPIFNLADVCIVVGVIITLLGGLIGGVKNEK